MLASTTFIVSINYRLFIRTLQFMQTGIWDLSVKNKLKGVLIMEKNALSYVGPAFEELDNHEISGVNGGALPTITIPIISVLKKGAIVASAKKVASFVSAAVSGGALWDEIKHRTGIGR